MHAFWRNDRVFKWCNQQGIHVTAYGPLSSPHMAATMDKKHLNLLQVCWFLLCVVLETPSFTSLHQAKVPSQYMVCVSALWHGIEA